MVHVYGLWVNRSVFRHDKIEEFNVDWKAECDQLNLAHESVVISEK